MVDSPARSLRGAARASFVADAARRAFALDPIADLAAVPELFEPAVESVFVAAVAEPSDVVLHAVGVHEAAPPAAGESVAPIRVTVRAGAGRVALLLSSQVAVGWDVQAGRGASIAGIYLASPEPSEVRCNRPVRGIVPVTGWPSVHRFETRRDDEEGARALLRKVREGSGRPLASFQGAYRGAAFTVPPYRDGGLVQEILAAHAALVRERTRRTPAPFWLVDDGEILRIGAREEPIRAPRGLRCVAGPALDGRFYGVDDHKLYAIDRQGAVEVFQPPRDASWLGGVAYDARRQRLVVTSRWHVGTHHSVDPASGTWHPLADVSDTGGGIEAIAYEPEADAMVAVTGGVLAPPMLVSYTPDLVPLAQAPHRQRLPLLRADSPNQPVLQVAALPKAMAMTISSHKPESGALQVRRSLLVELDADRIDLLDLDLPGTEPLAPDQTGRATTSAPYDGWVYVSELRRDAEGIVKQVQETREPLAVVGEQHGWAILADYSRYLGQLAALDETTFPDWSARLARAREELDRGVEADPPAPWRRAAPDRESLVHWTPQAAEDAAALLDRRAGYQSHLRRMLLAGAVPMDGPYAGLWVSDPFEFRTIHAHRGRHIWIAYIRSGTERRWACVAPLSETD